MWASASSSSGHLLSAAAWGRLLSELHRLKTFPSVELRGSTGGTQRNRTNLCPAPACRRRSPRNSQFLCRVSAADQVSRLAHPLISPPFPQHNTDSLQSSAGYFRRLAVCVFLPSGPSSLSSGNPAAGIASGTVDHESRQIAPFFLRRSVRALSQRTSFPPYRLPTCPIPIPCLAVVGDAEPGLSTSSRGHRQSKPAQKPDLQHARLPVLQSPPFGPSWWPVRHRRRALSHGSKRQHAGHTASQR